MITARTKYCRYSTWGSWQSCQRPLGPCMSGSQTRVRFVDLRDPACSRKLPHNQRSCGPSDACRTVSCSIWKKSYIALRGVTVAQGGGGLKLSNNHRSCLFRLKKSRKRPFCRDATWPFFAFFQKNEQKHVLICTAHTTNGSSGVGHSNQHHSVSRTCRGGHGRSTVQPGQ
jgi:hypothetical protein